MQGDRSWWGRFSLVGNIWCVVLSVFILHNLQPGFWIHQIEVSKRRLRAGEKLGFSGCLFLVRDDDMILILIPGWIWLRSTLHVLF